MNKKSYKYYTLMLLLLALHLILKGQESNGFAKAEPALYADHGMYITGEVDFATFITNHDIQGFSDILCLEFETGKLCVGIE